MKTGDEDNNNNNLPRRKQPPPSLIIEQTLRFNVEHQQQQSNNNSNIGENIDENNSSVNSPETDDERRLRVERENAEKNELSLIRMLVRHNQNIGVTKNINVDLRRQQPLIKDDNQGGADCGGGDNGGAENGGVIHGAHRASLAPAAIAACGDRNNSIYSDIIPDDFYSREEFARTTSLVSSGPGLVQAMSYRYKMVTSCVLWFGYFALALNDYIFGPTFNDLSTILNVSFDKIAYFAVYRQIAYAVGSLGSLSFDYINRQLALIGLLLVSGVTLFAAPFSVNLAMLYVIGIINGFAASACDVGFHVWILEMFQGGGGPLLQALHFCFGIGITIAPLITSPFLSGESECVRAETHHNADNRTRYVLNRNDNDNFAVFRPIESYQRNKNETGHVGVEEIAKIRATLFIPYAIIGAVITAAGISLAALYLYKRYIPPIERKLPSSFDDEMPAQLSRRQKLELWKRSVPSFYVILIIMLGSGTIFAYYGYEMTFLQFLAQFATAVVLPIAGSQAANLEAATGFAYSVGCFLAIVASLRIAPQRMVYVNFAVINIGLAMLAFSYTTSLTLFWIANICVGFGFSSTYATVYTFLEHQINITNMIGAAFLFSGGVGTAVFPLMLSTICDTPQYMFYIGFFCANFALTLMILMHVMTDIRGKQVKLIKHELLKSPFTDPTLTQFKERTLSTLSYEPQ